MQLNLIPGVPFKIFNNQTIMGTDQSEQTLAIVLEEQVKGWE